MASSEAASSSTSTRSSASPHDRAHWATVRRVAGTSSAPKTPRRTASRGLGQPLGEGRLVPAPDVGVAGQPGARGRAHRMGAQRAWVTARGRCSWSYGQSSRQPGPSSKAWLSSMLVQRALDQLGRPPTGEGGFADAAQPPAGLGVPLQRRGPHADDPAGIHTDLGHVEELHGGGVVAERVAEQLQPGAGLGDDHGLVAVQPFADERQQTGQEVRVPAVEQRLVLEAVGSRRRRSCDAPPRR